MNLRLKNTAAVLALLLLCSPMLYAWAKGKRPAAPQAERTLVPVSIQGVNHTSEPVRFLLSDPGDKDNQGGGEMIGAFSAGGSMCCYQLPVRWRQGIKIEVTEIYRPSNQADVPKVERKHVLEVPRYAGGEAGELWVTRERPGMVSIVSSNFQPDHPQYPGRIKGWPVPDLAYQRRLYDRYVDAARKGVDVYISLQKELSNNPKKSAQESWDLSLELNPAELKPFRGPGDPAYIAMLRKDYIEGLDYAQEKLKRLEAGRP